MIGKSNVIAMRYDACPYGFNEYICQVCCKANCLLNVPRRIRSFFEEATKIIEK